MCSPESRALKIEPGVGLNDSRVRLQDSGDVPHDESSERRNGSTAGCSGEHLTGSGACERSPGITNKRPCTY